uniref:Retinol dehydrogenase 14-like n=1 Tax=Saccoglossus kowalevskii TaxID=10224 RepID=A0ABM0MU07_SACKO|nr:PREDICTED: retinol dehydrogenase 14-like [Saccoglossus kowalevskii]
MAEMGYDVILACRSKTRGEDAIRRLNTMIPDARCQFIKCDLASLESIQNFVDEFHATGKPLHVLCNNAGLTTQMIGRLETDDGFEMTMGVNHLGHFLLTHLLLDDLKRTAKDCGEARVIVTTSKLHDPESMGGRKGPKAHMDFQNLQLDKQGTFSGVLAYKNAKLANVLFTYELARRLHGTGVTCNCFHPGFIATTELFRHFGWPFKAMMYLLSPLLRWFGAIRSLQHGGEMVSFLATDPSLKGVSGKYFENFREESSSTESYDENVATKLWKISEELVKLEDKRKI